jgi:hypothetical protein
MIHELERMRKEIIVNYFKVLPLHIRGGTEKTTKTSATIFGASTENRNEYRPNTRQMRYHQN